MHAFEDFRSGFPVFTHSTYLNTAAWGLMHEDLQEWRQEHDLDFLIGGSSFKIGALQVLDQTRQRLGACFGCHPDRVALVPNFSIGINLLAEGLAEGSAVLLLEGDYPSVNWPMEARFPCRKVPLGPDVETRIREALRETPADVLALSLVQWIGGLRIGMDFLRTLKEEFPELLIIADATQYAGAFPLDFDASGVDVIGASGYKWLLAGNGNGFMFFSEKAAERIQVKSTGFNAAEGDLGKKDALSLARKLEPGHLDTLNFGSLWFMLGRLQELGLDRIGAYNEVFCAQVAETLHELGLLPEGMAKRPLHSGIFNIPDRQGWYDALKAEDVVCARRGGGIRLSFHCYNSPDDLDMVVSTLRKAGGL